MFLGSCELKQTLQAASMVAISVCAVSLGHARTVSQIDAIERSYQLQSDDTISELKINRHYSSNSEFRGLFGFGWCSDLDGAVQIYADQSVRYLGCNMINGEQLDPRVTGASLEKLKNGFQRRREDGALQVFDKSGRLVELRFQELQGRKNIHLKYGVGERPTSILGGKREVEISYSRDLDLVEELLAGKEQLRFAYRLDVMIFNGSEFYEYGTHRRIVRRVAGEVSEDINYGHEESYLAKVERRLRTAPDQRLLMSLEANEESGEIEIKAERGTEMYPVRILYDLRLRELNLSGDRETARRILYWIKS